MGETVTGLEDRVLSFIRQHDFLNSALNWQELASAEVSRSLREAMGHISFRQHPDSSESEYDFRISAAIAGHIRHKRSSYIGNIWLEYLLHGSQIMYHHDKGKFTNDVIDPSLRFNYARFIHLTGELLIRYQYGTRSRGNTGSNGSMDSKGGDNSKTACSALAGICQKMIDYLPAGWIESGFLYEKLGEYELHAGMNNYHFRSFNKGNNHFRKAIEYFEKGISVAADFLEEQDIAFRNHFYVTVLRSYKKLMVISHTNGEHFNAVKHYDEMKRMLSDAIERVRPIARSDSKISKMFWRAAGYLRSLPS